MKKMDPPKWMMWLFYLVIYVAAFYRIYKLKIQVAVSLPQILFALCSGYFVYLLSLFVIGMKFDRTSIYFWGYSNLAKQHKKIIWRNEGKTVITSTMEELMFRFTIQEIAIVLFGKVFSVLFVSLIFLLIHISTIRRTYYIIQLIDIFLCGLFLCILYVLTESFLLCSIVHTVRNMCIIMNNSIIITQRRLNMERKEC